MEQAIEIKGVTKRYENFAMENLNLEIPKGCITGFIGRNGAGKSTTLKAVLNLIRFQGEIRVLGMDNRRQEREIKERLGVVLDRDGFPETVKIHRLIQIIRPVYRNWDQEAFQGLASRFGLDPGKKVSELSRGMRVKLNLAIALSHGAELLLLDEPTAGLDPVAREEVLDLLMEQLLDQEKTVFFSTHITSDLDKVADYIVLLEQGRVMLRQPKDRLLEEHCLVRGGVSALENCREALVGWRENQFGFEGLARREALKDTAGLQTEKPNVEQLMTYYIKGEEI